MRSGEDWTVGLVLAALAVASAVDRGFGAHVAVGLGLAACLLVIARVQGLTAADLGLARSTWPVGLRWGTAAATLLGAAYALAYLIAPVRQALPERWRNRARGAVGSSGRDPPGDRPARGAGLPWPGVGAAGPPVWRPLRDLAVLGTVRPLAHRGLAGRRPGQRRNRRRGGG